MEIFSLIVLEMIKEAAFNLSMTEVEVESALKHQALKVYFELRDELGKEEMSI